MSVVFKDIDPQTGIATRVHDIDGKITIEKQYDAQPLKDFAAAERTYTAGQRWGEMRKVGTIPMAELATMMRQDGKIDPKRVSDWLKKNQAFVTFDKFLK